jgi:RNA polymerase sigma-70 factor (ECF subfamily)
LINSKIYSEEELVFALKQKDEFALSYLYDNYSGALNNVILNIIKDEVQAEDILQEAFLKIWNNVIDYDASKGRLFTWMRTIVNNLTLDKIRGKDFKKQALIKGDETLAAYFQDTSINTTQNNSDLQQRIDKLDPKLRVILNMNYFEGYTQEQIATALHIPLGTIKTRIRSAILELRKTFEIN